MGSGFITNSEPRLADSTDHSGSRLRTIGTRGVAARVPAHSSSREIGSPRRRFPGGVLRSGANDADSRTTASRAAKEYCGNSRCSSCKRERVSLNARASRVHAASMASRTLRGGSLGRPWAERSRCALRISATRSRETPKSSRRSVRVAPWRTKYLSRACSSCPRAAACALQATRSASSRTTSSRDADAAARSSSTSESCFNRSSMRAPAERCARGSATPSTGASAEPTSSATSSSWASRDAIGHSSKRTVRPPRRRYARARDARERPILWRLGQVRNTANPGCGVVRKRLRGTQTLAWNWLRLDPSSLWIQDVAR